MTLPTFLGIGVPRAGTTWLHELLASHPNVFVPNRRKEINFFDKYYDRGIQWYSKFFPAASDQISAVGEISPQYLYCHDCPQRITEVPSIKKFLLLLRNPVERTYSYYKHIAPIDGYRKPFESFLLDYPSVVQESFYSSFIKNYLHIFDRNQFLVLIYERALDDIMGTKKAIAKFLDIPVENFAPDAGVRVINKSNIPRFRTAYAFASMLNRRLRKADLDSLVNLAKRLGLKKLFGTGSPLPPMQPETRSHLERLFRKDIEELEVILEIDLAHWKMPCAVSIA